MNFGKITLNIQRTNRSPMKIRKSILKWLVWMLAFFLVAGGVAQGAERCREKCCEETRASDRPVPAELILHLNTPMDGFLPPCHMAGSNGGFRVNDVLKAVSATPLCDDGAPACCHLGKGRAAVQALASKSSSAGAHRLSHGEMVFHHLSSEFLHTGETDLVIVEWFRPLRAAPIPLYLKKASFIC